jgi:hypothetical protein
MVVYRYGGKQHCRSKIDHKLSIDGPHPANQHDIPPIATSTPIPAATLSPRREVKSMPPCWRFYNWPLTNLTNKISVSIIIKINICFFISLTIPLSIIKHGHKFCFFNFNICCFLTYKMKLNRPK